MDDGKTMAARNGGILNDNWSYADQKGMVSPDPHLEKTHKYSRFPASIGILVCFFMYEFL